MPRRSTKAERRSRDTEELPELLADQVSDLIASNAAKPTVIVLQSRPGRGKTYVVQRLFDLLAARDTTGFWRPGLTPPSLPTDEEALRESRKRVHDPALRDIDRKPDWFWYGLSATHGPGVSTSGDPVLSELSWQVQSAIRLLRARRYASTAGRAAGIVSGAALELGFEKYGAVKTAFTAGRQLLELFASDLKKPVDLDDDLDALIQDALRKALTELTTLQCTSLIVLDDAHLVRSPVLHGLARSLVNGPAPRDQGRMYFDTAAPASDRRLIIVATSWSRPHGPEFWRWMDELQSTGVQRLLYREEDGWFSGFARERATKLFHDLASNISSNTAGRIIDRAAVDDRIAPILLMRYIVETVDREFRDDEGVDEFIDSLPSTVEEIAVQRFTRLPKPAKDAVLLAGALGYEFPLQALRLALTRRLGEKAADVLRQLIDERYLIVDTGVEPSLIDSGRFGDELDFGYARTKSGPSRWVKPVLREAIEDWFELALDHLAHDLEPDRTGLAYTDLKNTALALARIYLSRSGAGAGEIWDVCSALVDRTLPSQSSAVEMPREEPRTFTALYAWSLRHDRRRPLPLAVLRAANDLAPQSHVTAILAIKVSRRPDLSVESVPLARAILEATAPTYIPSALVLARVYATDGRTNDAKKVLASIAHDPSIAIKLAELHIRDGERETAKQVLASVADDPSVAIKLAELHIRDGERETAKRVLAMVPDSANAAIWLARLHDEDGQREAAIQALEPVLNEPQVAVKLADLYILDGQRENAKKQLLSFAGDAMAAIRLAELYLEENERGEAKKVLAPVATRAMAAIRLANLHAEDGQRAEAKKVLAEVPGDSNAQMRLAELHVEDGEREAAKAVLAGAGNDHNAARKLASLHIYDGDYAAALSVVEPLSNSDALSALMMARCADTPAMLAKAQNAIASHIKVGRLFVFSKITEHARSADDVALVIPEQSPDFHPYWRFLYEQSTKNDRRAAALYALLTARSFPKANESALRLVRPYAPAEPLCAVAMSQLQLSPADTASLRAALQAHAEAGSRSSLAALARLAIRNGDDADAMRIAALIRQQSEFTDAERELYTTLLGPQLVFRKLRDRPDPRKPVALWELIGQPQP